MYPFLHVSYVAVLHGDPHFNVIADAILLFFVLFRIDVISFHVTLHHVFVQRLIQLYVVLFCFT